MALPSWSRIVRGLRAAGLGSGADEPAAAGLDRVPIPVSKGPGCGVGFVAALVLVALAVVAWCIIGGHVLFTYPGEGIVLHLGG